MAIANHNILSVTQDLTEEEQSIVRQNIGAASSSEIGGVPYTLDEKNRLAGMETGAQVNTIETITMEGESGELPISSKDVTIPLAASATTDPVAAAKTGLMSGTDKAKLDAYAAVPAVADRSGKFMKDDGTWDSPKQVHHLALFADTFEVSDDGTGSTTETYWVLYDLDDPVDTSIDPNGYRKVTLESFASMYDRHEFIVLCDHYEDGTDVFDDISGVLEHAYITRNTSANPASVTDVHLNFIFANDDDGIKFLELSVVSGNYIGTLSEGNDVPLYNFLTGYGTDLAWDDNGVISVDTTGTANGTNAFVEGDNTAASGNYSHAEGSGSVASGQGSHAEGGLTTASNSWSHAEGHNTTANGNGAHSEGVDSEAVCQASHAGGYGAHITGLGCFGHGTFLNFSTGKLPRTSSEQTSSEYEYSGDLPVTVLGTLNATQAQNTNDHGGYLLIVGNGDYSSSGTGTRRDGFILHKDGTVKATAFQNASGTDNNVGVSGGAAFSGISNIEVFAATGAPNPANFPDDNVLRIILEN